MMKKITANARNENLIKPQRSTKTRRGFTLSTQSSIQQDLNRILPISA